MTDFKFDMTAVKKIADNAIREIKPEVQREIDKLARSHKGRPVAEVERELKHKVPGLDAKGVKNVAAAISNGSPIKVR